ncbi:hypothetical protein I317_02702 [Kwoniella heveanensis CBS 569]|nr:hypothetical protein I317_02702 [Kwoniella heveanensis CBS 569]
MLQVNYWTHSTAGADRFNFKVVSSQATDQNGSTGSRSQVEVQSRPATDSASNHPFVQRFRSELAKATGTKDNNGPVIKGTYVNPSQADSEKEMVQSITQAASTADNETGCKASWSVQFEHCPANTFGTKASQAPPAQPSEG